MPPPLPSRHLRPCRPSWSAQSMRRASPARIQFLSTSGDKPESPRADGGPEGNSEAQSIRGGWWSSAVAGVSSFGIRAASPKPESQSSLPSSSSSLLSTSLTKTPPPTSPGATRAVHPRVEGHAADPRGQQPVLETTKPASLRINEEPSVSSPPVRRVRVETGKPVLRRRSQAKRPPTVKINEARETSQTESHPSGEGTAVHGNDQASIQLQLQQLLQQVKILQDALAEKNATPPSTTEPEPTAVTSQSTQPTPSEHIPPSSRHNLHGNSSAARVRGKSKAAHVFSEARSVYRGSTNVLVLALNVIETTMPSVGAPMTSLLRKRLAVIACEAIAEWDMFTLTILRKYSKGSVEDLVREELPFVALADVMYERSIFQYVGVARDLGRMAFLAMAPVAARIRVRLEELIKEAKSGNDWRLRQTLEQYYAHNAHRHSKRPGLVTNLPPSQHLGRHTNARHVRVLAWDCYRTSTAELVHIAEEIVNILPRSGAPIVSLIQRRLVSIMREASRSNDADTIRVLNQHRKSSIMRPIRQKASPHSSFNYTYRRSLSVLASIAQELECMSSPKLMNIAVRVRDRLRTIEDQAKLENNERVLRHLQGIRRFENEMALKQSGATLTAHLKGPGMGDVVNAATATPSPSVSGTVPIRKHDVGSKEYTAKSKDDEHFFRRLGLDKSSSNKVAVPENAVAANTTSTASAHSGESATISDSPITQSTNKGQSLARQIQTQSRMMRSSDHPQTEPSATTSNEPMPKLSADISNMGVTRPHQVSDDSPPHTDTDSSRSSPSQSEEVSEQSLLEELFPEANPPVQSRYTERTDKYQKLDLPQTNALIRQKFVQRPKTLKQQVVESFQNRGEKVTVLQLEHCSTALSETDFRRLIPKGKHIEGWNRDGEFYKLIPGRDPLSLERLPFYYLLFKTPESAHAYQNNVTRLHKLAALHQPSNIFSAVPVPRGFLEDGEDVNAITKSYLLKPTEHPASLRIMMQPYHPALRCLIERGGYTPIVPDLDDEGNRLFKVLLHIEGYEPSKFDLFKILRRDAYLRGTSLNLRNESLSSIHRLRDIINLKTRALPISTTNPRAFGHFEPNDKLVSERKAEFEDPVIQFMMQGDKDGEEDNAKEVNQMVVNRVYNRWMIEFDEEDEARRFAAQWHRRVLPDLLRGDRTWKDYEEVRMCNCEVLW